MALRKTPHPELPPKVAVEGRRGEFQPRHVERRPLQGRTGGQMLMFSLESTSSSMAVGPPEPESVGPVHFFGAADLSVQTVTGAPASLYKVMRTVAPKAPRPSRTELIQPDRPPLSTTPRLSVTSDTLFKPVILRG